MLSMYSLETQVDLSTTVSKVTEHVHIHITVWLMLTAHGP